GRKLAEELLEKWWRESYDLSKNTITIDIKTATELFLNAKLGISDRTRQSYLYSIKRILSINTPLKEKEIERQIQDYIISTNDKPTSININLRGLRVFLRWCVEQGYLKSYQFIRNYFQKTPKIATKNYTEEEVKQIIEYFEVKDKQFANLIKFLVYTGCRIVDALTLEWEQVKDGKIFWLNKITKEFEPRRYLPIVEEILEQQKKLSPEKVFPWRYSSVSSLAHKLKKAKQRLGIYKEGCSFHGFRVYFRMKLLRSDFPLEYVVYLMRHSNATVTLQHYTHFLEEEIIRKAGEILK
ncbi:MAG: site-specific integrase, partial [Ignavibacteria bacterium]|nr:site-specific integrase [Ignavibacteria bacterium]